ncbi:hypothetical protein HPB47_011513 [Ixodes persulcatus]|uniref:Uncharacterized protein n=1 Tax=Ixodes persulcatus TaxID=34615 RepID=A0AC60NW28_IXOPE|nr:hypothetical protein HPB47_011513 [Ixodes persulcatus]
MSQKRRNSWSSDEEAQVIRLYENHSLLWDSRHPDYYNREKRDVTMRAIAEAMSGDFDVVDVKDKIKILRDYFVKELKKEDASRKAANQGYVSRWEHFRSWDFLRSAISSEATLPCVRNAYARTADLLHGTQTAFCPVYAVLFGGYIRGCEATETMILPSTPPDTDQSAPNAPRPQSPREEIAKRFVQPRPLPKWQGPPVASCVNLVAPLPPPVKKARQLVFQEAPDLRNRSPSPQSIVTSCIQTPEPNHFSIAVPTMEETDSAALRFPFKDEYGDAENGDVIFCRHVISELRQMPKYQRDLTKLRIQQALFEVKYANGPYAVENISALRGDSSRSAANAPPSSPLLGICNSTSL